VIKKSRFGPFLGCSGYPECTNTRRIGKDGKPVPLPEPTGVACPKCHEGELLRRRGKFGRPFYGCSRYPKCDYLTNSLEDLAPVVETPVAAPAAVKGGKKTSRKEPLEAETPPSPAPKKRAPRKSA